METPDESNLSAGTTEYPGGPLRRLMRTLLPRRVRRGLAQVATRTLQNPPIGAVRFGSLRRLDPISSDWGFDRGVPIDRHYIEGFLEAERGRIRGRVLEIDTNDYTRRFGGDQVHRSDVLHLSDRLPEVTLLGDLATGEGIPEVAFDCLIVTQTLHFVFDIQGAVRTLHRILRPGGSALVTFPGLSRLTGAADGSWGSHWALTRHSAARLFGDAFPGGEVHVQSVGNVLTATAFLQGLAAEELTERELAHHDPDYELLVMVRATRKGHSSGTADAEGSGAP